MIYKYTDTYTDLFAGVGIGQFGAYFRYRGMRRGASVTLVPWRDICDW